MSKYSEYSHSLTMTANSLREISVTLTLLRNLKRKREEPVAAHIRNKKSNITLANNLTDAARLKYDVSLQELKMIDIIPVSCLPTFNELKDIAETSEERDR